MAARSRRLIGAALGAALLLAGCAGAPPPRKAWAPPAVVSRSPQAAALEVALNEFYGAAMAAPLPPGWIAPA
jgi:hypothetical protein